MKPDIFSPYRKIFTDAIARSEKDDIYFNVTLSQLHNQWKIQNGICALTGRRLSFGKTAFNRRHSYTTASLDRKDSRKGYTIDNIQWVHKDVNKSKSDFSKRRYVNICRQVAQFNS